MPEPTSERSNFDAALALLDKYSSVAAIPLDELAAIGYTREGSRMFPIGRDSEAKRRSAWEHKVAERPFETIPIQLPVAQVYFQPLYQNEIDILDAKIVAFNEFHESNDEKDKIQLLAIPNDRPYHTFIALFSEWIDTTFPEYKNLDLQHLLLYWSSFAAVFRNDDVTDTVMGERAELLKVEEGENYISGAVTEEMDGHFEVYKGQLADIDELEKRLAIALNKPIDYYLTDDLSDEVIAEKGVFKNYLNNLDVYTVFDLLCSWIGSFLTDHGLVAAAQLVMAATNKEELVNSLAKFERKSLDELILEERAIRAKIKEAATKEEKILQGQAHSERLKQIDAVKKETKQLLLGVADFFNLPQLAVDFYRRKIAEMQEMLVAGNAQSGVISLTLDARPDADRDANPGKVSGDCTVDSPLPFADPSIPIYNVKVMEGGKHRGNMYLLKTTDEYGRKVWHLDAIQIPNRHIDWAAAVPLLAKSLAEAAAKSDVSAITVNNEEKLISNYAVIGQAVLNYVKEVGEKETEVVIPSGYDTEKYSQIQGSGEAFVLARLQ